MARCVFSDFDHFADTISGLDGRYIPTAPSLSDWWINLHPVARLQLQQLQVGAPSAFAGDGVKGELTLGIPISDPTAIQIDGQAMSADSFILIRHGHPLTYSAQGVTMWAGVTLPDSVIAEQPFLDPAELAAAKFSQTLVDANYSALRRVSLLVGWLCNENESMYFAEPAARAAAEEDLLMAVAELLRGSACASSSRMGRPRLGRDRIIARTLDFLSANAGQPILVSDLCRAAEVSERTLRNAFTEYFGVGPMRFLKARQLQEIRSAFLRAAPQETITSIVARFGVWDFGAFARNYKAMYGENPSTTRRESKSRLAAADGSNDPHSLRSWVTYASRRFAPLGSLEPAEQNDR